MPGLVHSGNKNAAPAPIVQPNPDSSYIGLPLYKKQPTGYTLYQPWLSAKCAHVIHRPVHSFRGQVKKLEAAVYKALRADLKVFPLTLEHSLCSPGHFA
jgi:hypothetical protein